MMRVSCWTTSPTGRRRLPGIFASLSALLVGYGPATAAQQAPMELVPGSRVVIATFQDSAELCGVVLLRDRVVICERRGNRLLEGRSNAAAPPRVLLSFPADTMRIQLLAAWSGDSAVLLYGAGQGMLIDPDIRPARRFDFRAGEGAGRYRREYPGAVAGRGVLEMAVRLPSTASEAATWAAREGPLRDSATYAVVTEGGRRHLATSVVLGFYLVRVGNSTLVTTLPLETVMLAASGPGRIALGTTDESVVQVFEGDGRLRGTIRWEAAGRRVPAQALRQIDSQFVATGDAGFREHRARAVAIRRPPSQAPRFDRLLVDADARIWIRSGVLPGDRIATWMVYGSDLRIAGNVSTPPAWEIVSIAGSVVIGLDPGKRILERALLPAFGRR
jgi:hypothetical protein